MMHSAWTALRKNFSRSLFYWLTFLLVTAFIFAFFVLADAGSGLQMVNVKDESMMDITFLIAAICMIEVFFANDFYVRSQSRELGVMLICGARYSQMAGYILIQTTILLLLAVPGGIAAAYGLIMPVMKHIVSARIGLSLTFRVTKNAVIGTAVILILMIFWTTYLNMAFAYRHQAVTLFRDQQMRTGGLLKGITGKKKPTKSVIKAVLFTALFILCPLLMIKYPDDIFFLTCLGMVGFAGMIRYALVLGINTILYKHRINDPQGIAVLGFLREDFLVLRANIILLILSSVLLISVYVSQAERPMVMTMALLSYIMMSMLMALALLFRYEGELPSRKKDWKTLRQLGYTETMVRKAMRKEVLLLYGGLFLGGMLYIGIILGRLASLGRINGADAWLLALCYMIPLILTGFAAYIHYRRTAK